MESHVLFPVRCNSCGKVLGNKQIPYEQRIAQGMPPDYQKNEQTKESWIGEIMTDLGITRYCCRMRVLSAIQIPLGRIYGTPQDAASPDISTTELLEKETSLSTKKRGAIDTTKTLPPRQLTSTAAVPSFSPLPSSTPLQTPLQSPLPSHLQVLSPMRSPPTGPGAIPSSIPGAIPKMVPSFSLPKIGLPSTSTTAPPPMFPGASITTAPPPMFPSSVAPPMFPGASTTTAPLPMFPSSISTTTAPPPMFPGATAPPPMFPSSQATTLSNQFQQLNLGGGVNLKVDERKPIPTPKGSSVRVYRAI